MQTTDAQTTSPERFGLFLLIVGAATFTCLSILSLFTSPSSLIDFRTAYFSARCLVLQQDPYDPSKVLAMYRDSDAVRSTDSASDYFVASRNLYPPTEFIVTVPFALLPFRLAELAWIFLTIGSFILASFLMWRLAAPYSPELSGALCCFLLANSEQILLYGNPVGIALSFCVIAVWCFLRQRYLTVGIICLTVSLAVKPHDSALVWLYFFLAGAQYRKRSLHSLALLVALGIPAVLWVSKIAPHWPCEILANIRAFTVHGGINDPGPAGFATHGTASLTQLQSVFSVLRDDPRFYNLATYAVCVPLVLVWIVITLRSRPTLPLTFMALASIAPISMLPLFHRMYDAKLIMLAIPACALLWSQHQRAGRIAVLITAGGLFASGDLPWATYIRTLIQLHLLTRTQPGFWMSSALAFPLPLMLLIMGIFYLWTYWTRASQPMPVDNPSGQIQPAEALARTPN